MRDRPLILVAGIDVAAANRLAAQLRREGNFVCVSHGADGCLRVATSVGPDVVLLDPALPQRVVRLLRAHPASRGARILPLGDGLPRASLRPTLTAGPHAA
jgi:CheY-like chemotaxis protein